MISYVTLGTNDLEQSGKFYDEILSEFGAKRVRDDGRLIYWSAGFNKPGIAVAKPFDAEAATVGNGVMAALSAQNQEQVNRVYNMALELGGTCEGEPGPRGGVLYAAYFRDLDGNKLNVCCPLAS